MARTVLFDGAAEISYGQFYLTGPAMEPPVTELAFDGQRNELCGAATPGALLLRTGLQHGSVGLTVERHSARPVVGDEWVEVVEASFTCPSAGLLLWGPDTDSYEIALPAGRYGVTYCARDMQAGWDAESNYDGPLLDYYLLLFWPAGATPAPERVVRLTSDAAKLWGHTGDESTGRLEELRVDVDIVHAMDPALAGALERSTEEVQRSVSRWGALRALSIAELVDDPQIAPVVALLEHGRSVPPPFDFEAESVARQAHRLGRTRVPPVDGLYAGDSEWPVREWAALSSVSSTAWEDPLEAALGALVQAAIAYGADEVAGLTRALHEAYPGLRG